MFLKSNFSIVYHDLLQELIQLEVPTEEWSDCQNCHHCSNSSNLRSETKCCDFTPMLPNFIIGSILSDRSFEYSEGRERIKKTLSNQLGVTPYGIYPNNNYQELFSKSRKPNSKVTREDIHLLKCPYYKKGNCTIYKYRTDFCGFFHCSPVALNSGKIFWEKIYKFNSFLDRTLSIHIAKELGFTLPSYPNELKELVAVIENKDRTLNKEEYTTMWKEWNGSVIDYFVKCANIFHSTSVEDLQVLLGFDYKEMQEEIHDLSRKNSKQRVSSFLRFNKNAWNEIIQKRENKLFTPREHLILQHFDGKTKTSFIVRKANRSSIRITELLQKAIAHDILQSV